MYGQLMMDVQLTPPRVAWQMLRNLRHAPPGRAAGGERKATFNAALEQSEQFFTAAAVAGTATRPVLVFYGLTQAGWAIAAAAGNRDNNHWRLRGGHGIQTGAVRHGELRHRRTQRAGRRPGLVHPPRRHPPRRVGAQPDPPGAVVVPAARGRTHPAARHGGRPRPPSERRVVCPSARRRADGAHLPTAGAPGSYHPSGQDPSTGQGEGWEAERHRITKYLAEYPGLSSWAFLTSDGQPAGLELDGSGSRQLWLRRSQHQPDGTLATPVAVAYRGEHLAFPRVGGSPRLAHPFLLWWAVCYALSMLARYEPRGWAERIALGSSSDASPVEYLLDQALAVLPELIHRTVFEAAQAA